MNFNGTELNKITDYLWEIPQTGKMRVPGRIYSSLKMLEKYTGNDEALKQVINVAHLPGIQKYSLAMPDIHWGYGFPIGGVAATDIDDGVISPGGVGYDINCGVRLAGTNLQITDIQDKIGKLVNGLFQSVPTGVGASGAISKVSAKDILNIMIRGAGWAVEHGFGAEGDLENTEEKGCLEGADVESVSGRAKERGRDQAGTLGSGNHFLEIDVVEEIYDLAKAEVMGLFPGQVLLLIHTGSRGLGYQVCDDYLKIIMQAKKKYSIDLPDKQLACAPVKSDEGQKYLSAMKCAANFAWNNRQVIMHLAKESLLNTLKLSESSLGFELIYDVCHNIAKIEEHNIDGKIKKVCVHRKGATRAFAADSRQIPLKYRSIGQPVLIPGDMGRYSYISVGTEKAMEETFGSSCHGAGRVQSRHQALKTGEGRDLLSELKKKGIIIRAKGYKTIAEEMSFAYKDVSDVVDTMHKAGISKKVAKIRPVGVIKG